MEASRQILQLDLERNALAQRAQGYVSAQQQAARPSNRLASPPSNRKSRERALSIGRTCHRSRMIRRTKSTRGM
jgi:hypothetical protein